MRVFSMALLLVSALAFSAPASAGIYGDDLSKCLVSSSSDGDKLTLVQWIFAAMSANSAVKPMSTVTAEQLKGYNQRAGAITERLLLTDCRQATIAALKYEGVSVLEKSFATLGEVAMRALMNDPATAAAVAGFADYLDDKKFSELGEEAGIKSPATDAKK